MHLDATFEIAGWDEKARSGGLILRHIGTFSDGAAKSDLTVVGGSGDFEGAAGTGSMVADPGGRVSLDRS